MATATENNTNTIPLRKQQNLPGIGRDIPEVEAAAIKLRDHRAKRMEMQEREATLKQELLDTMAKHEVETFKFEEDGVKFTAKVKHKTNVSVTKDKPADDSEDA